MKAYYSRRGFEELQRGVPVDPESYDIAATPERIVWTGLAECSECHGNPVRYVLRGCGHEAVACLSSHPECEPCRGCGAS